MEVEILILGILTGFLSRQLAGITDKLLMPTMIFGFIRLKIARLLDRDYMNLAMETLPDDYEDYNEYFAGVYSEIEKKHKLFTLLICPYCMSFWYNFILVYIVLMFYFGNIFLGTIYGLFYFLISITFNDLFFKL